MHTVTLKVAFEVSAQAGQSGAVESTVQDDFHEERDARGMSNDTSQTTKKSIKPVPTSAAVTLPLKAVITRKFFAVLRSTVMGVDTTGAENALPVQEAPRKPSRPPSAM
jgi:hypothetical protein